MSVLISRRAGELGASLVPATTDYDTSVSIAIVKQSVDGLGLGKLDALELE